MANINTKISFTVGNISFQGEGDAKWLEKQLDKLLEKVGSIVVSSSVSHEQPESVTSGKGNQSSITLAKFLSENNSQKVQTKKFLATAAYLQTTKGMKSMKTSDVTSALRTAGQSKLNNASDCLNQNVTKGLCEKDGDGFFVTHDGLVEFGVHE